MTGLPACEPAGLPNLAIHGRAAPGLCCGTGPVLSLSSSRGQRVLLDSGQGDLVDAGCSPGRRLSSARRRGRHRISSILSPELIESPSPLRAASFARAVVRRGLGESQPDRRRVESSYVLRHNATIASASRSTAGLVFLENKGSPPLQSPRFAGRLPFTTSLRSMFTEFARYTPKRVCFLRKHRLEVVDVGAAWRALE